MANNGCDDQAALAGLAVCISTSAPIFRDCGTE